MAKAPLPPIVGQIARLEAELLVIMAEHAGIRDRGFLTRRKRHELHREWDTLYDQWRALRLQAYAEGVSLHDFPPKAAA